MDSTTIKKLSLRIIYKFVTVNFMLDGYKFFQPDYRKFFEMALEQVPFAIIIDFIFCVGGFYL